MGHLKILFAKYMNDSCTTAEIKILLQTFNEVKNEAELKHAIALELQKEDGEHKDEEVLDARMSGIYERIRPSLDPVIRQEVPIHPIRKYFKYGIAAAVLIICSTFIYRYYKEEHTGDQLTAQHQQNDVNPGGNKAILTLADGSQISLTDAGNGELARQSGIIVTKTADGHIVYEITGGATNQNEAVYNTISTPAGGQYQINLPDGSTVWLNAASSLKYPTVFNEAERKVELKGEAYFEVAKNTAKPFIVSTNGAGKAQEVTVLGTHFNINSYADEAVTKTTLLEGSIKVSSLNATKILQPGQQSTLGNSLLVSNVDAALAVDWKNGYFNFDEESITSIMRKLARWYDIDVVYKGEVPTITFGAALSRDKKLSEILNLIQNTREIHFKIEGRRVIVMQ